MLQMEVIFSQVSLLESQYIGDQKGKCKEKMQNKEVEKQTG
jgi:hypothetical protein